MEIMECRKQTLEATLQGYNATNVPLISSVDGNYIPAGYTDDLGLYYFIPWIAEHLGISVSQATTFFLGSLIVIGATFSICCFVFIFKHWISRSISIFGLSVLALAAYRYSDVYIAAYFAVATIVPLFIVRNQKDCKVDAIHFLLLAFCGIIAGYCNLIRSHSGTGCLLFLVSWIFLKKKYAPNEKFMSLLVLIVFTLVPFGHFKFLEINRDKFLVKVNPSYAPRSVAHPKWHSIYIGFGYLENKYGITYCDTTAAQKVYSVNPAVAYCSSEYEEILRDECFGLFKNDPLFVCKTIFFKALSLLFRVLKFANFGLLVAFFYLAPSFRIVSPFIVAALFYSVPGLLTMPNSYYVSGLTSVAVIFGVFMICLSVEKYYFRAPMNFAGSDPCPE